MKGNLSPVIGYFKNRMEESSRKMEFEKAAIAKSKLENVFQYKAKSAIVSQKTGTVDVFSILENGDTAYVNYLATANGTIVHTKTIVLNKKLDESPAEVLSFAIADFRKTFNSEARELVLPFAID